MRPKLSVCKQETPFWCWATGITDLDMFYNASETRSCKDIECDVVSQQLGKDCCGSPMAGGCYTDATTVSQITKMAKLYLERDDVVTHTGPLSEDDHIKLLEQRVPIMVLFQNAQGGGHVELHGGCDPHPPYPLLPFWQPFNTYHASP